MRPSSRDILLRASNWLVARPSGGRGKLREGINRSLDGMDGWMDECWMLDAAEETQKGFLCFTKPRRGDTQGVVIQSVRLVSVF